MAEDNVVSFEEQKLRLKELLESGSQNIDLDEFTDDVKLAEMNDKYAFINSVGGKPMVMTHVFNPVFQKKVVQLRSPDAIITQYSNQSVKVGSGYVELGRWWIKHANRREYEGIVFLPGKPKVIDSYYNSYEGMAVDPVKGCWKVTLYHIYNILCNRDPIKFKYVIRWFAWCVQNPGRRAEVAVIFKGKQGAGKGFIFTQFVQIFGQHAQHVSNRDHLAGKFNEHFQNCVFLFADEAYYPGDKEVAGAVNQLISEEKLAIEAKYRGVETAINCLHIGMATNEKWVIPATEDVRRYFINTVDNKYAKNESDDKTRQKYFDALWGEMNNGGREAMLFDMLAMDLGDWHPRSEVPETDELNVQKAISLPPIVQAVRHFIDDGVFPGEACLGDEFICSAKGLRDYFVSLHPSYAKFSHTAFVEVIKFLGAEKRRKSSGVYWAFPTLKEVRKNFKKEFSKAHKFDDMEENWAISNPGY